jgi:hypothetical protein
MLIIQKTPCPHNVYDHLYKTEKQKWLLIQACNKAFSSMTMYMHATGSCSSFLRVEAQNTDHGFFKSRKYFLSSLSYYNSWHSCCNRLQRFCKLQPSSSHYNELWIVSESDLTLEINTDFKLTLYTDDTSVIIFGNNMHETQAKLSIVLNTLYYWFTSNGLSLNLKKTVKISNHLSKKTHHFN